MNAEKNNVAGARRSALWWTGIVVWFASVTTLSMAPLEVKNRLQTTGSLHDLGHFVAFAVTASLFIMSRVGLGNVVAAASLVWAFGAALEVAQAVVYGNNFEWRDVGVNAIGAIVGANIGAFQAADNRSSKRAQP